MNEVDAERDRGIGRSRKSPSIFATGNVRIFHIFRWSAGLDECICTLHEEIPRPALLPC